MDGYKSSTGAGRGINRDFSEGKGKNLIQTSITMTAGDNLQLTFYSFELRVRKASLQKVTQDESFSLSLSLYFFLSLG